ncbi:unnamed protein product [Linum tenue]|uniref:Aminopeptidase n=1 Tax=Linum tenue TaxID=586396 RepID=A0AAV0RE84_9ROSI|nr:unnamed protein product [Linum tenue]
MGKKKKKDIIRLERESVIPIVKRKIISALTNRIEGRNEKDEFVKLCQRAEYMIRAWYLLHFEEMMQLYALFEPIHGDRKIEQHNLTPEDVDICERHFLNCLFQVMERSNFKITTDGEIDVALAAQYRLNLPIVVDESKKVISLNQLDKKLFTKYFSKHPKDNLPHFADKYIIFRRGFGIDQMTAYFIKHKINTIIMRLWMLILTITGLKWLLFRKKKKRRRPQQPIDGDGLSRQEDPTTIGVNIDDMVDEDDDEDDLFVERIRIEKMPLSFSNLFGKVTIQEPTFDRIIVVYRRESSSDKKETERNMYVKHFKGIPMADMEIVLPEKKNPGLTPMDWVKFLVSALIGLATVVGSLSVKKVDIRVIFAILTSVGGYCVKTYFTFQSNLVSYQSLITQSVYDKQLDSGRGTLLHLCDEVIQQEVKEVIISFFILIEQGEATRQELDGRCEDLLKAEFGENCNFDVDDALQKLEKLKIDDNGKYRCVGLREANDIIGTTTEEVVLKATGGVAASTTDATTTTNLLDY